MLERARADIRPDRCTPCSALSDVDWGSIRYLERGCAKYLRLMTHCAELPGLVSELGPVYIALSRALAWWSWMCEGHKVVRRSRGVGWFEGHCRKAVLYPVCFACLKS